MKLIEFNRKKSVVFIGCLLIALISLLNFNIIPTSAATSTFYSEAGLDGFIGKSGTSYPPTSAWVDTVDDTFPVGQQYISPNYYQWRLYLSFDTSPLPDNAIIDSATFYLRTTSNDYSDTDFAVQVYAGSYGSSLDTGDWGCGTNYQTSWLTQNWQPNDWVTFGVGTGVVSKTGRTQFELKSNREGTTPTGTEFMEFYSADSAYDPYLVVTYHTNVAPVNDALTLLTGASYKGTKTLLASKQDYKFVYQVTDADGVTDLTYAEIRLDYASKNVILRATRGTGDAWTFSEQSDPSNYVTLNVSGSSHSTSGNQKTFNFLVKINWNWDDATETLGVMAYAYDNDGASDQDNYANVFGVENDLSSASLSVSDYKVNPSQTLTFSGYWVYEGTSIYPPDGDYQAKVKLSGVQKGSTDTTLVNGAFSIGDVTAETSVGNYSYTVEATYMISAGSFSGVTVDGLNCSNYSIDMANAQVYVCLKYASDNSPVSGGSISLAGRTSNTNSTGWAVFDMTSGADFDWSQIVYGVQDAAYGITYKAQNQTLPIARKTRFIESDAEISSLAWNGVELTIGFTNTGTYVLKISGPRPVYVKGIAFDLSTDYTSYLTLDHEGARNIVAAWPSWEDLYIRSLSQGWIEDIYLTGRKLTIVLNGTGTGVLAIYCGSWGFPQSGIDGLASPEYDTETKILSGQVNYASPVTVTLDWTLPAAPGPSGGPVPTITFTVDALSFEMAPGTVVNVVLKLTWMGTDQLTVTDVRFSGMASDWVGLAETLPKILSKPIGEKEGSGEVNIRVFAPSDAPLGDYTVPITVDAKTVGTKLTTTGWITFTVAQPSPALSQVPDYMTYIFAALLLILVAYAYLKRR